eukprot:scaffold457266_cov19-Prasinocladus_malaysianus.AAC.1
MCTASCVRLLQPDISWLRIRLKRFLYEGLPNPGIWHPGFCGFGLPEFHAASWFSESPFASAPSKCRKFPRMFFDLGVTIRVLYLSLEWLVPRE